MVRRQSLDLVCNLELGVITNQNGCDHKPEWVWDHIINYSLRDPTFSPGALHLPQNESVPARRGYEGASPVVEPSRQSCLVDCSAIGTPDGGLRTRRTMDGEFPPRELVMGETASCSLLHRGYRLARAGGLQHAVRCTRVPFPYEFVPER